MRSIASLVGLVFLAACGQAGDLYLPEPDPGAAPEPEAVDPYVPEPEERKPGRPQGG